MENSAEIIGELRQISPFLAENRRGMPYAVPMGYFDMFPQKICGIIQGASTMALVNIPGSTIEPALRVPEGYFDSFAGNLLEKIRRQGAGSAELDAFPVLNSIARTNVFTVPAGYFEQPVTVPQKQKAKLVTLARKWTQYAAAAVVAGILVTTAFLVSDNTREPEYNKVDRLDLPTELDQMSENELVNYLVNPEIPASNNDAIADVKNNIHSVSDEELDQYLKENTEAELFTPALNN